MKKIQYTLLMYLAMTSAIYAQKTPVEFLIGHNAINTQINLNRKFGENSKFGIFSIVNFNMPFDKTNAVYKYHIVQANVYYSLTKNFRIFGGAFTNPKDYGASLGVQAIFPFKNGVFLFSNRHSIVKDYVSEFLIMTEFRPKINSKLNLYSRVQVMSETDFEIMRRNFQMLRLGLSYQNYQFGLGATFDQFGNKPIAYNNIGLFARVEL
jgi:hypothetical protein